MKTLKLVFFTAAGKTMSLSLKDPKDDLELDGVRQAAGQMIPAMAGETGDTPAGLKKASIIETSEVVLQ